jgi:hypothetical protein
VAWQAGGVHAVLSQPDGRRACRDGMGKVLPLFLMRRDSIRAEALQLLATAPPAPLPLLALGLPENPYI